MRQNKGFIVQMPNRKLTDIWYNLKQSLYYFKKFFWSIWWFRGMDYSYTLDILLICLKEHLRTISTKSRFQEIEETRIPKENKLKRAIELLENKIADNYAERCGYDSNFKIRFEPAKDLDDQYYIMVSDATPEQVDNNNRAIKEGNQLRDKEWQEFTTILYNDIYDWWT